MVVEDLKTQRRAGNITWQLAIATFSYARAWPKYRKLCELAKSNNNHATSRASRDSWDTMLGVQYCSRTWVNRVTCSAVLLFRAPLWAIVPANTLDSIATSGWTHLGYTGLRRKFKFMGSKSKTAMLKTLSDLKVKKGYSIIDHLNVSVF